MSSQHKLYHYEVVPPAEAWERIAQELNGVNEFRKVSQKLQNLQVAPPAPAWEKIREELDDQQEFYVIGKKLSALTVTPPPASWNRIEAALDGAAPVAEKKVARVIPMRTRVMRYAAAAALIGIVALAAFFVAQRPNDSAQQQARLENNHQDNNIVAVQPTVQVPTLNNTNEDDTHVQATTGNARAVQRSLAGVSRTANMVTTRNGNAYSTTLEKNREVDGRYIVLMTEEGNVVRMNKKVSSMADCIAGEDDSHECTHKIAAWQKEIASMPVLASSPDNILGLLELAVKEPLGAGL